MKRRDILKGFPLAIAAGSAPALALVPHETPQAKVQRLVDELKLAMTEAYGTKPQDKSILFQKRGVVALAVMPHSMDELCWHIDDGSPLFSDEATGTTAYADWEKRRSA